MAYKFIGTQRMTCMIKYPIDVINRLNIDVFRTVIHLIEKKNGIKN